MALVDYECDSDSDNENDFICVVVSTLPKEGEESEDGEDNDDDDGENDDDNQKTIGKKTEEKNNTADDAEEKNVDIAAAGHSNAANDNKQVDIEQDDKKRDDDKTSNKRLNVTKQPVRIEIPPLPVYNSDEEETPKKVIKKLPEKTSGLFSLLPSPKAIAVENQKFDANIVKQKNLIPRNIKINANGTTKRRNDSDDEEISSSDFFSFNDMNKVNSAPAAISTSLNIQVDSARPVRDTNAKSNSFFANLVANSNKNDLNSEPVEEAVSLEENAIEELCGKRKKKAKNNDVQFIDINAADIMPDPREYQTKALTEEGPTDVKKGEEPSQQSRRKHQITYLAYQAKMNEQELQNQWAQNRMTRKQTQAKYGF